MIERDAIEFRKARANELRRLADVLDEWGLIRDPAPLKSAASLCAERRLNQGEEFWGYTFDSLEFPKVDEESFRHSRPEKSELSYLELGVSLSGPCLDDNALDNPFSSLSGDIVATGLTADGNRILKCAWHLDKHIRKKGDPEPSLAHPEYHFQHGGKNIRLLTDYGVHQILESPRIAHPPLDAILLVDFILSNYCGSEWKKIRVEDSTYKELIVSAQERYWSPYVLATAVVSKITTSTSPWKAKEIWPQLLIDRLVLDTSAEA
jgi:hypothetical protein